MSKSAALIATVSSLALDGQYALAAQATKGLRGQEKRRALLAIDLLRDARMLAQRARFEAAHQAVRAMRPNYRLVGDTRVDF